MLAFLCCPFLFPLSLPVFLSSHTHASTHTHTVGSDEKRLGSFRGIRPPCRPRLLSDQRWTSRELILHQPRDKDPSRGPSRRTKRRPPRRYKTKHIHAQNRQIFPLGHQKHQRAGRKMYQCKQVQRREMPNTLSFFQEAGPSPWLLLLSAMLLVIHARLDQELYKETERRGGLGDGEKERNE